MSPSSRHQCPKSKCVRKHKDESGPLGYSITGSRSLHIGDFAVLIHPYTVLQRTNKALQHANKVNKIHFETTHPEYLLNSQDAFHKDGSQLVSNPRQQKAKERDAKYCIKNAKDFSTLRSWSYVSITCQNKENKGEKTELKKRQKQRRAKQMMRGRGLGGAVLSER